MNKKSVIYGRNIKWANLLLIISLCLFLTKPLISDLVSKTYPEKTSDRIITTSQFMDLGSFMESLKGLILGFMDSLNPLVESTVSELEKQNAAEKELKQASLNYDASQVLSDVNNGAVDQISGETSDVCEVMENAKNTVDAKQNEGLLARALSAGHARRGIHTRNSSAEMASLMKSSTTEYCSAENNERGMCSAGVSPKGLPDADVNAQTIFTSYEGSGTLNREEFQAASKFVSWSTDPIPMESVPISIEKTPDGQRYLSEVRRRQAIMSSSQFALNRIISSRYQKK